MPKEREVRSMICLIVTFFAKIYLPLNSIPVSTTSNINSIAVHFVPVIKSFRSTFFQSIVKCLNSFAVFMYNFVNPS